MRQKAELRIREATAQLPGPEYRIDMVRERTDLVRKVFDKTILDMARLGTIMLYGGSTEGMTETEIGNLILHGTTLHIWFMFLEPEGTPTSIQTVDVTIKDFEESEWGQFEHLCEKMEGKTGEQKLKEIVRAYIRQNQFE